MASIRQLKKRVKSLYDNVQTECYVELLFGTSNEVELIWSILYRSDILLDETMRGLNSKTIKKKTVEERKQYYKELSSNFYTKNYELINDLNTIIP